MFHTYFKPLNVLALWNKFHKFPLVFREYLEILKKKLDWFYFRTLWWIIMFNRHTRPCYHLKTNYSNPKYRVEGSLKLLKYYEESGLNIIPLQKRSGKYCEGNAGRGRGRLHCNKQLCTRVYIVNTFHRVLKSPRRLVTTNV